MEGKEYREEEDDNLNSKSSDKNDSKDDQDSVNETESDDFGLPEVEDADSSYSDDSIEDSFEDSNESNDDYSYNSDSEYESDYNSDSGESGYYDSDQESNDYDEVAEQGETNQQRDYYIHGLDDTDKGGSRVGWLIGIIIFIILLAAGYWWFFMREPAPKPLPKPKPKPAVVDTIPKMEETPIIQDEKSKSNTIPGQVVQLSTPNGRYYVIVASFIDVDLAMDYGKKLAKDGVGSTILSPKTGKGFYRLALADFESLNDATLESERLKSTYGQDVWVIRY